MADWTPLPRAQWDLFRVPIPGFTPKPNGASYTISLAGVVRRSDGLVWRPSPLFSKSGMPTSLVVRLGGGKSSRSLAQLMFDAFAVSRDLPTDAATGHKTDRDMLWCPWLLPTKKVDKLTGERPCSIDQVVIAPFSEIVTFTRSPSKPKKPRVIPNYRLFAAFGRDVPIPREMLLAAGYTTTRTSRHFRLDDVLGCHRIHKRYTRRIVPC